MDPMDVPIVGFFATPRILGKTLTADAFLSHFTYGAIGASSADVFRTNRFADVRGDIYSFP